MAYTEAVEKFLANLAKCDGNVVKAWLALGKLVASADAKELYKEANHATMEDWLDELYATGKVSYQKREIWDAVRVSRAVDASKAKMADVLSFNKAKLKAISGLFNKEKPEQYSEQLLELLTSHKDKTADELKGLVAAIKGAKSTSVTVEDVVAAQAAEPVGETGDSTTTTTTSKVTKIVLKFGSEADAADFKALLTKFAPEEGADLAKCATAMVKALHVAPVKVEASLPPLEVEVAAA